VKSQSYLIFTVTTETFSQTTSIYVLLFQLDMKLLTRLKTKAKL